MRVELQRELTKDDFLFPGIASTGRLKFGSPVTRADIDRMLDSFVAGAELLLTRKGKFTTHCFRRGGAQWRFMWQPGRKWSLKAVKWWGGWAPSESVSSLSSESFSYLIPFSSNFQGRNPDALSLR